MLLFLLACGEGARQKDTTVIAPATTPATAAESSAVSKADYRRLDQTIYRYRYESKPDSMAFHILFACNNDSLQGVMFGVAEAGEHGVFFLKSAIDELTVSGGWLHF